MSKARRIAIAILLLAGLPALAEAQPCTVYKTWAVHERLTSADLNASFQRTVDANIPQCVGDYSVSVTQMQAYTDPYPSSTESLATTLAGEIERLRYQVRALVGKSNWYEAADNSVAKGVPKHWGATFTKFSEIADPTSPPTNELALYAKDDGAGVTVLAYKDSAGNVTSVTGAQLSIGNSITTNLVIANTAPAALTMTADRISVEGYIKRSLSVVIDCSTTGANACDAGSLTTGFGYVWVIYNPTTNTFAGLFSASETAPAMPAGYTKKRVVGGWAAVSGAFLNGRQVGDTFLYGRTGGNEAPNLVFNGNATTAQAVTVGGVYAPALSLREVFLGVMQNNGVAITVVSPFAFSPAPTQGTAMTLGPHVPFAAVVNTTATGSIWLPMVGPARHIFYYATDSGFGVSINIYGWKIEWREP